MFVFKLLLILIISLLPISTFANKYYFPMKILDRELTLNDKKIFYYCVESYFRESYYDFFQTLGDEAKEKINKYSFVVVRPDAIVSRSIEKLLIGLRNNNFEPIYLKRFKFDRYSIREMWRYNLNKSPLERFDLLDHFLPITDCVFILVKDTGAENRSDISCSVRLSRLKGSVNLKTREPHHLRSFINAKDGLFSFIHTPDDSADFIREIGVLFPAEERLEIVRLIKCNQKNFNESIIEKIYKDYPSRSLEFKDALKNVSTALSLTVAPKKKTEILSCLESKPFNIKGFLRNNPALDFDLWDIVILNAKRTPKDIENIVSLFDDLE